MPPDKKIEDFILESLRTGKYFVTKHARERAQQRNFGSRDIEAVGKTGQVYLQKEKETFKVEGKDSTNDDLTLIIAVDGDVIIITGY